MRTAEHTPDPDRNILLRKSTIKTHLSSSFQVIITQVMIVFRFITGSMIHHQAAFTPKIPFPFFMTDCASLNSPHRSQRLGLTRFYAFSVVDYV
jgi:hypothetical protein